MNKLLGLLLPILALATSACQTEHPQTWLVIKCLLTDGLPVAEGDDEIIQKLFMGPEGIQAYYTSISYGAYVPQFKFIAEWKTVPQTIAEDKQLQRGSRIRNCMNAHDVHVDGYDGVIVLREAHNDAGNAGQVLMDRGAWNVTFAAHEMNHTLGLGHSYDFSDRKNSSWSAPGEYFDYWDIMSAMAVYDFKNVDGYKAGPDMTVSSKLILGWLPDERVQNLSLDEIGEAGLELRLSRYDMLGFPNPLAIVISLPGQPEFYTLEYRAKTGWDRAIPDSGVLIHYVARDGTRPYIVDDGDRLAGENFGGPEGLNVEVVSIDDVAGVAVVRLRRQTPFSLEAYLHVHEAAKEAEPVTCPAEH